MMPVEGEVLEASETFRCRERNASRVPDVLPPSKDEKLAAMSRMTPVQQVDHVTELLVYAHAGLLVAIAAQDLPGIAEAKQKAATMQEIVKQLRMGNDMHLDSAEFVRRAERGLGVAIRDGQERGEIETQQEARSRGGKARHSAGGSLPLAEKPKPTDYADSRELFGHKSAGAGGIYDFTDGVSDEDFEVAISDARAEGNLTRTNVARKARGRKKEAIDSGAPLIDAEVEPTPAVKKTARARRTIEHMAVTISNFALGLADLNPAEVDKDALHVEIDAISDSIGLIRKFLKEVNQK